MSFNAGAIIGHLQLDTSEFTGGFNSSLNLLGMMPPQFAAIAAAAAVAFNAVAGAASFVGGIVADAASRFDDAGEAAEKVGVSVEFLTSVGAVAADAGSSIEGFSLALKFLNNNAADAAAGNKTAMEAFTALGVSVTDANGKLMPTEQLFYSVANAIGALSDPAMKTQASMNLFGKAGSDLIPMLNMGGSGIQEFAGLIASLQGNVTSAQAAVGGDFQTLSTVVGAAWTGIQNAVATPILQFISDHMNEIVPNIVSGAAWLRDTIGQVMTSIYGHVQSVWPQIVNFAGLAGQAFATLKPHLMGLHEISLALSGALGAVLPGALMLLAPILAATGAMLSAVAKIINDVLAAAAQVRDVLGGTIGSLIYGSETYESAGLNKPIPGMGGSPAGQGQGVSIETLNVGFDASDTSTQIANKIRPQLSRQFSAQRQAIEGMNEERIVREGLMNYGGGEF